MGETRGGGGAENGNGIVQVHFDQSVNKYVVKNGVKVAPKRNWGIYRIK